MLLVAAATVGSAWAEPKFPLSRAPEPASSVNDPVTPAPPAVGPVGAPEPPMPPPAVAVSMKWAGARLAGAVIAVGLLLVGAVIGYRKLIDRVGRSQGARGRRRSRQGWWSFWAPDAPSEADRIHLASRRHLGPRESLGVVRVGRERFLVGITGGSISLLARLAEPGRAAEGAEPDAADFALELDAVTEPRRSRRPEDDGGAPESRRSRTTQGGDTTTAEPRRAFFRPPTVEAGLAAPVTTEPGRAFLRPPTAEAGPADPVTPDPAIRLRIARSRDRLSRIGRLTAVAQDSRD